MLSFCLLHSEMVAPKMEMKSSPCFLEVSPVLAQGLDKRGGGKAAPLFQPQAAWFHIFSALICYPCHACFITPILLPSQVLRNGDQCPWEAIALIMHAKLLQSCQTLNLWTIAHQDPLSMGFSRQEYWSGLPCLPPRDLPQESNRHLLRLLNWQVGSLPLMSPGKPFSNNRYHLMSRWYISDAVLNILLLIFTTFNGRYYESHLTDWETKA